MDKSIIETFKKDALSKYGKYLQQSFDNAEEGHENGYLSFEQIQSNNLLWHEWRKAEDKWIQALLIYGFEQDIRKNDSI
jgi:hypothetical protein